MRSTRIPLLLILLLSLALSACSTARSPQEVNFRLKNAYTAAQAHAEAGQQPEALQMIYAIENIDPDYEGVGDLKAEMAKSTNLFNKPVLGSNRALRPQVDRTIPERILLYLPDRICDLLDIVSFDVHLGAGAYGDIHATRAIQAAGGFRSVGGLGLHEHRSLGVQSKAEAGVTVVAVGALATVGATLGTSGIQTSRDSILGLHKTTDPYYQQYRDYWAIGASVTAGIAGVEFDFHPVQVVDFVAGIFTFDLLNDDFARTRGLDLSRRDKDTLLHLIEIAKSEESISAYLADKAAVTTE